MTTPIEDKGHRATLPSVAMLTLTVAIAASVAASGCAAPYTVRNVGRGHTALHLSVGGPLVSNLGVPAPIPATVIGAQYGITDDWDISGSFHLLAAFYKTSGLDVGVTRRILTQKKWIPEWTATLRLSQLTNFHEYRIYPELESYASYLLGRRWLLYFGMSTLYDFFWDKGRHFRIQWGPALGLDVRFAKRYAVGVAFRWISPNLDREALAVDYVAPGHLGSIFVQLAFRVNIQGWKHGS
ncbi:MAG: hypothetical protein J7M25_13195 [Deltaproteobacteria bacterium]|nr:hypothetical protein [Deltaproteobacteria bacterium]